LSQHRRPRTAFEFTHLHVASSYSLRFGTANPAALVARAAELDMPALALTDRDGLYGAFKHVQACAEAGIKPILGADLALRPPQGAGPETGRGAQTEPASARVTLLAEGRRGWSSLCHLVTAAHAAEVGATGRADASPAVTAELIARHSAGLVLLLGPASDVGQAIAARRPDLARRALNRWRGLGCEAVIEVVDHLDAPGSTHRAARMTELAEQQGAGAVLANAVRYLEPADSMVAQVLDAARHLVPLGSPRVTAREPADAQARAQARNSRAFLADAPTMAAIAARIAAASGGPAGTLLRQTAELASRLCLDPARDLGIGRHHMPEATAAGQQATALEAAWALRVRCESALPQRGPGISGRRAARRVRDRMEHELAIITATGTAPYFLTVADIADRIRASGIRCAIRGSGAGSYVNHLIGISAIDPLEHGLLMERFLSAIRTTLPDIDLDVESARRLEAYQIIFDAYGEERTACVSMMETYRARSAIRDVAAAMSLPPDEIGRIAKAFPHIRARHITSALADLPELKASNLATPQLAAVFSIAEKLDGLPRHVAMHPCGILLSDATLRDRTAMQRSAEGFALSHLDKDDAEIAGVIKLDVLGVRMQSAMAYTITEIARTAGDGNAPDLDAIPRDDAPTYAMISEAKTLGCFQIESPGQRELVRKLAPACVDDLIVDISLFRPGPVSSDMISPFLRTRHGLQAPSFPHERLRAALAETGGVVVYHEQVLRILDVLTGCGLDEADLVRRHLSTEHGPRRTEPWFRAAALRRGYDRHTIDRVWEVLAAFGGFGFCKAHAAAFAIPVYQSAWLKRHHPAAFYAGVLTHDPGMYPKRVIVADARLSGVPVLPLDVNASADGWKVAPAAPIPPPAGLPGSGSRDAGIRVSLREVKGISDAEVERIVAGQPYASLRDFWDRARVSRPIAERLVLTGAFDSIYAASAPEPAPGPVPGSGSAPAPGSGPVPSGSAPAPGPAPAPGLAFLSAPVPEPQPAPLRPSTPGGSPPSRSWVASATPLSPMTHDHGQDRGPRPTRRDLLARVGVLDRTASRASGSGPNAGTAGGEALQLFGGVVADDWLAGLVPAGQLRDLDPAERVAAELDILGFDVSQHVLEFYAELVAGLGVVRSTDLARCRPGETVLVAGVKVATQTPAVRSGQRIIFATLDDAVGLVDLAFFESVQERCAARLFGSWLLLVRGNVRRSGAGTGRSGTGSAPGGVPGSALARPDAAPVAVTVNGAQCWDIPALDEIRVSQGMPAVRAVMAAANAGAGPGPASGQGGQARPIVYGTGFALSPWAETGGPGAPLKRAPRDFWHASPGSSGDTGSADD
jgi:error-prone DNA polymerase